ncbi:uncharacterized protein [Nicotiana tomentosiformis]|uniref:uncharacterized protein n=1 Tax=Nicotiana tomentosiformis TaxID=4098 RepID=UPI00388C7C45
MIPPFLYHPGKANVVADAFSRKIVSMGSLAYNPIGERTLAAEVQTLANQFVSLDVSGPSRVLACIVARSSLYERIRERQYDDPHLLVLKDTVRHSDAKQVSVGEDGVLRMQGHICVPNVDELLAPAVSQAGGGAQTPTTPALEKVAPQCQAPAVPPVGIVQPVVAAQADDRPSMSFDALLRLDKFTKLFLVHFSGTPTGGEIMYLLDQQIRLHLPGSSSHSYF